MSEVEYDIVVPIIEDEAELPEPDGDDSIVPELPEEE